MRVRASVPTYVTRATEHARPAAAFAARAPVVTVLNRYGGDVLLIAGDLCEDGDDSFWRGDGCAGRIATGPRQNGACSK